MDTDFSQVDRGAVSHIELTGMRRLASAVLIQAVSDLQRGLIGRPSYDDQFTSAKELLCVMNADLVFWCALANINCAAIVERSMKMLKAPPFKLKPITTRRSISNQKPEDTSKAVNDDWDERDL